MDKRTTLKDIAKRAGVSAVTVHKVLYSKDGVSEYTRKKILGIAGDMEYSVNMAASSLKRKAIRIAAVFRGKYEPRNFFFHKMWEGVDRAESRLSDYRVRIIRIECEDNWESQDIILRDLARNGDVDGVILHCWDETKLQGAIDNLFDAGIPVVTVNSDAPASKRVACVSAPNERVGRLAAEVLGYIMPEGRVLLAGGIKPAENLAANRRGFSSYMRSVHPSSEITEIYNYHTSPHQYTDSLRKALTDADEITGIYAITARDTYNTCMTVAGLGLSSRVRIVGSDVFEEMKPFFDDGTLDASIWKDQQSQAERAVAALHQYLSGQPIKVEPIRLGVIMKNNFDDYL
ncbi:MAG: substrate-binding domain-containing protein [Synergistaceae bacterium]|jgi:LacI family transcriptional regulator|nr:substrate-binding domain-containing protein [Synergistaceae bacterium]